MRILLLFILLNFISTGLFESQVYGQCMQVPISLEDRIKSSQVIIEGTVIAQEGIWDTAAKNIYTIHEVQVDKVFNGITLPLSIKIVTRGGIVNLDRESVTDAMELSIGMKGTFFLTFFQVPIPVTDVLYKSVAAADGVIYYNRITNSGTGVFETYESVTDDLYPAITAITGIPIPSKKEVKQKKAQRVMTIQGFEPQLINAGIANRLTIQGIGFGSDPGTVLFADANNGGRGTVMTLSTQIISWSDSTIIVEVPTRAGTGTIAVLNDGIQSPSVQSLEVFYNHLNLVFDGGFGDDGYETQLINDNFFGGYTFQYFTDFAANTAAASIFDRLTNSWSCGTGFNTNVGSTTTVDEDAADGVNIVRFDNGDELSGNTLAYARSRYRGCLQNNTVNWYVQEIEVVINDDFNWYYGSGTPANNQIDFETVLLHEIGHAQQLGHVIDASEVMHFSVGFGQKKRVLSTADVEGGRYVMEKSTSEVVCNQVPMTAESGEECSTLSINDISNTSSVLLYPNPTQGKITIERPDNKEFEEYAVYNLNGTLMVSSKWPTSVSQHQLDLSGLPSGIYLLSIASKNATTTTLVTKE